jgi:predicted nucleic acid-binding protein
MSTNSTQPSRRPGYQFSRAISFRNDLIVIFLLDTNAISALMREDPRMALWLSSLQPDDRLVTCPIARGEILFGLGRLAHGRRRTELEAKAEKLFAALPCESIPPKAGDHYASVKLAQQRHGVPLDENDLWVAAGEP